MREECKQDEKQVLWTCVLLNLIEISHSVRILKIKKKKKKKLLKQIGYTWHTFPLWLPCEIEIHLRISAYFFRIHITLSFQHHARELISCFLFPLLILTQFPKNNTKHCFWHDNFSKRVASPENTSVLKIHLLELVSNGILLYNPIRILVINNSTLQSDLSRFYQSNSYKNLLSLFDHKCSTSNSTCSSLSISKVTFTFSYKISGHRSKEWWNNDGNDLIFQIEQSHDIYPRWHAPLA